MSLSLALNNALSGLSVNQSALAVTSNNIANANTEGYTRQIVDQSARVLAGVGAGVQIDAISRKVDVYLERSILRENSNVSKLERTTDYYQRMQILIGEPGSENSIDEYVENFFNAMQSLAESPDRVSFQATVANTAETLSREISGLATSLEDLRLQADRDIASLTSEVNQELRTLHSLNITINQAVALNSPTAGLLDQRDGALNRLSELINIEIFYKESGAVNVYTGPGIALVDEDIHQLEYRRSPGIEAFIADSAVNPVLVVSRNEDGEIIRQPSELISGGVEGAVTSQVNSGALEGLRELRDVLIPDILSQLDQLAARLRDEVNAVHNDGSGFPPADELNGTRLVSANEAFNWSGQATIAALGADGLPSYSVYDDEIYGYRPLELDFDFLNSGMNNGEVTTQTIINEINNHFNAPPVKAQLGNLNNVQLVSTVDRVPTGTPASFSFDLDLDNLDLFGTDVWLTGVTVRNSAGVDITSVTDTAPQEEIASYDFIAGSNVVTVNTTAAHDYQVGDRVYLEPQATGPFGLSGVDGSELGGFVIIRDVTGPNSFTFEIATLAAGSVTETAAAGTLSRSAYKELEAGDKLRTRDDGVFTADLSSSLGSEYFDITIDLGTFVTDPDNVNQFNTGTITYRVYNQSFNQLNQRFDATDSAGTAVREFPQTPHQYIFARLVDENGNELPKVNGSYGSGQGFLQLVANDLGGQEFTIAIAEGSSQQQGKITLANPAQAGTNRGFSHYFELNNFFASNAPNSTGDAVSGSAVNFRIEDRLVKNPNLISTGSLEVTRSPIDPDVAPPYTLERFIGNNEIAQKLAKLGVQSIGFAAAGGLPDSTQSFNGYISEILGFLASNTVSFERSFTDNEILLNGYITRSDAIKGVNLDEELANTIIFQNAYSASARIISVTDELFGELIGIIR